MGFTSERYISSFRERATAQAVPPATAIIARPTTASNAEEELVSGGPPVFGTLTGWPGRGVDVAGRTVGDGELVGPGVWVAGITVGEAVGGDVGG